MRAWSFRTEAAVSPSTANAGNGSAKIRVESKIRAVVLVSIAANRNRFMSPPFTRSKLSDKYPSL